MIVAQRYKTCRQEKSSAGILKRKRKVSHLLAQHTFVLVIIRFWRTVNSLTSNATAAHTVQFAFVFSSWPWKRTAQQYRTERQVARRGGGMHGNVDRSLNWRVKVEIRTSRANGINNNKCTFLWFRHLIRSPFFVYLFYVFAMWDVGECVCGSVSC